MSKLEQNINSPNIYFHSDSSSKSHYYLLGNKTKREKIKKTPKLKISNSKYKTNYKTRISRKYSDNIINEDANTKQLKLNNDFDFHEEMCIQLNNNYISQNIILMNDYMKSSKVFTPLKRIILVDWVMAVCCFTQFKRETFHMTISIIDICLSKIKSISIDKIQLIGTSCLLISSKFLELFIPDLKKYSEFGAETYSVQEIKENELEILNLLDWKLNYVNIFQWSNIFLYKWNIFIKEYSYIFKFKENDNNKLYNIYYYIIDTIVLDYYYRFYDMKKLCVTIIYLSFGYQFKFINDKEFNLSKLKNYDNLFNKFVEIINNNYKIDNFREYIPYVLQFINKDLIIYLNERFNQNEKMEKINIFYQDYDNNKTKIAKQAIKNYIFFNED